MKNTDRKRFLLEKNKLRTLLKNYELISLDKILPIYFHQKLSIIYKYRFQKNRLSSKLFIIFFNAILWNLFHNKSLIEQRIWIKAIRKKSDKEIFLFIENLNKYIDLNKTYVK